jgi:hypothetical protein
MPSNKIKKFSSSTLIKKSIQSSNIELPHSKSSSIENQILIDWIPVTSMTDDWKVYFCDSFSNSEHSGVFSLFHPYWTCSLEFNFFFCNNLELSKRGRATDYETAIAMTLQQIYCTSGCSNRKETNLTPTRILSNAQYAQLWQIPVRM